MVFINGRQNIRGDLSKNDKYLWGIIKERQIFVEIYQRTTNIRGDLSKNDKYLWGFIKERQIYPRTINI